MSDRHDWRNLDPLPEAERPPLPESFSMSLLSRQAVCPRSALLYHLHRGGPGSLEMERGSAYHEFARRAVLELVDQNEPTMPPEVARDLMQAVMDEPEFVVSAREADRLRVAAYHFSEGFAIDPSSVLAVEAMLELDLGWVRLRGKVDLAFSVDEATIGVRDWKTSPHLPTQSDFEDSFQQPFYAVLLAFGKLEGEPFPLAQREQFFDLAELYPMQGLWGDVEKQMPYRGTVIARPELADHRAYVEGVAAKLRHAFETGEFDAIPGSQCGTCAAPEECPLPARLRPHRGELDTLEKAEEAAARWNFENARLQKDKAEIKALAEREGWRRVMIGSDLALEFSEESTEEWITGKRIGRPTTEDAKQAMLDGIDRAVRYGEPFDYGEYRRTRHSTKFAKKKVDPAEVEPVAETVPPAPRDFGEDAPF